MHEPRDHWVPPAAPLGPAEAQVLRDDLALHKRTVADLLAVLEGAEGQDAPRLRETLRRARNVLRRLGRPQP